MLVCHASCYLRSSDTPPADAVAARFGGHARLTAPHVIDEPGDGSVRAQRLAGAIGRHGAARQAVRRPRATGPGERRGGRLGLLERARAAAAGFGARYGRFCLVAAGIRCDSGDNGINGLRARMDRPADYRRPSLE